MSFEEDLRYSHAPEHDGPRRRLFRQMFPDYQTHDELMDSKNVRRFGVDYLVFAVRCGQGSIHVQEKLRRRDYGDFLLEVWSVWRGEGHGGNRVGWGLDPEHKAHVLTYVVVPTGVAYVMKYPLLRTTAENNCAAWLKEYGWRSAKNPGYETRNIAVPWSRLERDMGCQVRQFRWGTP